MIDVELREALHSLGIDESGRDALPLLPVVYVAWSDGTLQPEEHAFITELATTQLRIGPEAARVLDNWLKAPPSAAHMDRGCAVLIELNRRVGGKDVDIAEFCQRVAEAAGSFFGKVNRPEREALEVIGKSLAVDPQARFTDLVRKLNERAADDAMMAWLEDESTNPGSFAPTRVPPLKGPSGLAMGDASEETLTALVTEISIGRGRDNSLQLAHDGQSSRRHCIITREADGAVRIRDLGSSNGTLVNGERIVERRLFGGEEILVGETVLRYRA